MSTYYNFWRNSYLSDYITLEKLQSAKDRGLITQAEYDQIILDKQSQGGV